MNHYTVTAPDGTIHTRNTKSHTYNYAVLFLCSKETELSTVLQAVATYEGWLADARDVNDEERIAHYTGLIAMAHNRVSTVKDTWLVEAWRRDYDSALQACKKIGRYANVDQAIVMETTQIG